MSGKRSKGTRTLEAVAKARARRANAERTFREALIRAREVGEHSWGEIADAAGLDKTTVRYYVLNLNERRKAGRDEVPA